MITNRHRIRATLVSVVAISTAAAVASASPASAATSYSSVISTNPASPVGTTVSLSGTNTAPVVFTNADSNASITCRDSRMAGTSVTRNQTAANPSAWSNVANVSSVTFANCTSSFGPTFTVTTTATGSNPWLLDGTGSTVNGRSPLQLKDIAMTFTSSSCSFRIGGTGAGTTGVESATYDNATRALSTDAPATLSADSVNGTCGGVVKTANRWIVKILWKVVAYVAQAIADWATVQANKE